VDSEVDPEAKTEFHDPLVMRARTRVGTVLHGKWRLDVLLGVGGMAAVYAATHRNGSRAAVKVLHPELSLNPQVRTRFLREGYAANAVGHDGAVKVIDDDIAEDGSAFLVMELLDGETLEDRRVRSGGKLSEDDVLSVADQLLDVLTAAHAKGVVHRDLKPENVFVTRTGAVKVLDFGIARLRELSTASTATKSGATMGTPYYMAPEQARGLWDQVDGRTDLWAVGATMFHLLSGEFVHDGRTTNEVLLSAMTKPAPLLGVAAPNISPAVTHVVDRALAFDRDVRWRDAQRMQGAVRQAYHDRYQAPIDTAPRLTVPETVPNRTLPSAEGAVAPRLPTTGQPLASSRGGLTDGASGQLSRGALVGLAVGGSVVVGVVAAAVVVVVSRGPSTTAGPSASGGQPWQVDGAIVSPPQPSAPPIAVEAAAPSALPETSVAALPSATAVPGRPQLAPSPRKPAPTKRDCNPPYYFKAGIKTARPGCENL
jgi:serine/threonine-protein kinase